jgi:hypothetical protein
MLMRRFTFLLIAGVVAFAAALMSDDPSVFSQSVIRRRERNWGL